MYTAVAVQYTDTDICVLIKSRAPNPRGAVFELERIAPPRTVSAIYAQRGYCII